MRISPLQGIEDYIREKGLDIEVVSSSGANTEKKTDFFNMIGFSTVRKDGSVTDYDATKFDAAAKGLIASERFGRVSVRGIKDGDWTLYHQVDLSEVDSMRFNMTVSGDGGVLEVRVGSVSGNILASDKIEVPPPGWRIPGFRKVKNCTRKDSNPGYYRSANHCARLSRA